MAALLKWANATVTVCHSRTKNLEEVCKNADVIVAAVGKGALVKASWVKPGAVVIDCGINPIPDPTKKSGPARDCTDFLSFDHLFGVSIEP